MAKAPQNCLVLHGVVGADHEDVTRSPSLALVPFRDVAAVVRALPAGVREPEDPVAEADAHRAAIDALFKHGAVLPAPVGVVIRDKGTLLRWLEVHYVAFSEALSFIDGRCAGRVHVTRAPVAASTAGPLDVPPLDLDATATELFRTLRRHAAASTIVRHPATEAERASAAFLVETERWSSFAATVDEERRRSAGIRVELTGPWPPYDFVKMQFGG